MARVQVVSDDGKTVVEIVSGQDEDDAVIRAVCPVHGDLDGDHNYFQDMVGEAEKHVDYQH